jgi:tetratricopeptide (TPR) repeat protein
MLGQHRHAERSGGDVMMSGSDRGKRWGLAAAFVAIALLFPVAAKAAVDLTKMDDATKQQLVAALLDRAGKRMLAPPGGAKPPYQSVVGAVKDIETAIKLDPGNYYAHHLYGYATHLLLNDRFAIGEYSRAIELNPQFGRAYWGRASAELGDCLIPAAEADTKQAVALDPSLATHVSTSAQILARKNECAIMAAQERAPPSGNSPGNNLGFIMQQDQRQNAIERAYNAEAQGDPGGARIIREQNGIQ